MIRIGQKGLPEWFFSGLHPLIPDDPLASLAYALVYVAMCWVPIYFLYRKNILLKV